MNAEAKPHQHAQCMPTENWRFSVNIAVWALVGILIGQLSLSLLRCPQLNKRRVEYISGISRCVSATGSRAGCKGGRGMVWNNAALDVPVGPRGNSSPN